MKVLRQFATYDITEIALVGTCQPTQLKCGSSGTNFGPGRAAGHAIGRAGSEWRLRWADVPTALTGAAPGEGRDRGAIQTYN